jgi:hypothetical protein
VKSAELGVESANGLKVKPRNTLHSELSTLHWKVASRSGAAPDGRSFGDSTARWCPACLEVTAQEAITAKHTKDAKSAKNAPDALCSPFACFAYFAVHSGAPE